MKLSLMFIAIVSLVGLSRQQRFLNEQWMSSYFAPRHQFPSVYLIPGGYVYQHSPQSQPAINYPIDYQNDEGVETEQSIDASYFDNQGRVKAKTFLFGNMLSSLISASLAALNQRSLTSTAFTTVVQTATIASVQNCLAAAQFANAAAQANPCRRRRGISTEEIEAPESIAPSEIQSLEATLEPRQRRSETIPEISSSQEQEQSSLTLRGGRGITIVTVTSPTTSFVFSTTTIKKNVNLGNAAQLLCLPAGFTVC